uniref:Helicase SWR1 n=1 Tax=Zeugodacus cucurbitae TaxID=28588 RepID=A0A0A1WEJ9_ZEUCU
MSNSNLPYVALQMPSPEELSNASAPSPPPVYMQTTNVTSVQPTSSGIQITDEPQEPNFRAIPTNPVDLDQPTGCCKCLSSCSFLFILALLRGLARSYSTHDHSY